MNNRKRKKSRKSLRAKLTQNCGQLNEDDCVDPRDYFKPKSNFTKPDRKTLQLCRQVEHALSYVLAEGDEDSMLGLLQVIAVVPAPDASRLLVTLYADDAKSYDHEQALAELEEHKGRLRCEVTSSISRKRTPMLIYNVLPPMFEEGGDHAE